MKRSVMSQLLILRDLASFPQAWRALNDMLIYEREQMGQPRALEQAALLGIWIEPSLLPPCSLRAVNSFGLSGVWSLCEWELNVNQKDELAAERKLLMDALSNDQLSAGKFFPAFEISESTDFIRNEIGELQSARPGIISSFLIYDRITGRYRIKKIERAKS